MPAGAPGRRRAKERRACRATAVENSGQPVTLRRKACPWIAVGDLHQARSSRSLAKVLHMSWTEATKVARICPYPPSRMRSGAAVRSWVDCQDQRWWRGRFCSSGRGRGRREWVIKLVGAGAVRRPASGERQVRRQGPGARRCQWATIRPIGGFSGCLSCAPKKRVSVARGGMKMKKANGVVGVHFIKFRIAQGAPSPSANPASDW
jgi:hypothetical protein